MKALKDKLIFIQAALKAPKSGYNSFGKYSYRSAEDILEALKPLLKDAQLLLTLKDEIKEVGPFVFVEAVATLSDGQDSISTTAQAGLAERKGMDISQAFGASSSYARKYALGGLFLIDDTKDADATNKHDSTPKKAVVDNEKPWLNKGSDDWSAVVKAISDGKRTLEQAMQKYKISKVNQEEIKKQAGIE